VAAELSPRAYATAILETLDFLAETKTGVPVLASGLGRVHALKRRLTLILAGGTPRGLTATVRLAWLAVAGLLLPLVPVVARMAPPAPEPTPAPPEQHAPPDQPPATEMLSSYAVTLTPLEDGQREKLTERWTTLNVGDITLADPGSVNEARGRVVSLAGFKQLQPSADGQYVVVVWTTQDGQHVISALPQNQIVLRAALSPDGRELVTENLKTAIVRVLDAQTGKELPAVVPPAINPPNAGVTFVATAESDASFLRRVYLDLIGRTPSVEEERAYLNVDQAVRRRQLVERLKKENPNRVHQRTPTYMVPTQPVPVPYPPALLAAPPLPNPVPAPPKPQP
jgi:hypothetical protein